MFTFNYPIFLPSSASYENSLISFYIYKGMIKGLGEVKSIKNVRSGDLLIETAHTDQANKIVRGKRLGDIPVSASAHASLNISRIVVSDLELLNCSEEEILKNIKEQHVITVKMIIVKRDGIIIPIQTSDINF